MRFTYMLLGLAALTVGCEATTASDDTAASTEDSLKRHAEEHWFYSGPLDELDNPEVTISLAGHTARVHGFVPSNTDLSMLPHAKVGPASGGSKAVDLVYPLATAAAGSSNSRPGTYHFYRATLFRTDGMTTSSSGTSFVTWGGFPFLAYNQSIAMHGPITFEDNESSGPDFDVFYLKRGKVSHGCNRMLGEHVTEIAHILGMSMRKVYDGNRSYDTPNVAAKVIADYDKLENKFIDVDYPTDTGVTRPAKVHGADKVMMFGSWVASEMPNGADLPKDKQWEGGVSGVPYDFQDHAKLNWVCSMPRPILLKLRSLQQSFSGSELPKNLCAAKACVVRELQNGRDARGCL